MCAHRWPLTRAVLVATLFLGCAGRIPLPKALQVSGTGELLARMGAAQSPLTSYSAEARLTYFGPDGRVRATASLVVKRPQSLRYELEAPQGGVVSAFATNGVELEFLDLTGSRFLHGPATSANIDALLPLPPLGLAPQGWVLLLFGEVHIPADAGLHYDDRIGRFVVEWSVAHKTVRVEVDPHTSRPTHIVVQRHDATISEVEYAKRDERGLPATVRITMREANTDVQIKLRDVEYDPKLADDIFMLTPPAGIVPEYLSSPQGSQTF